jgi:hypothetical protein
MSLLANLTTDDSIANEKDSVGGNSVLDSGLYGFTVSLAYLQKSAGGALALALQLKSADGKDLRQTLWMTSGTEKGCKNYYEDSKGEKHYLPGFIHANALCLLTLGKEIGQLETEQKVINLYSSEAKAEVPTKVDMVMDLIGQEIIAGVIKQTVDKTKKDEATGKYVATGETREENEIDKFFRASDRKTTAEIRAQAEEAVFATTWETKWAGKVKDRAKGAAAGLPGVPKLGAAPAATGTKKPTTSLFG